MARLRRTPQANEDLLAIWDYIARGNLSAADNLLRKIDQTCWLLANNPRMGQLYEQYRRGLRGFTVSKNYIVFYHEIDDGIEVVRVLDGRRYLDDLL